MNRARQIRLDRGLSPTEVVEATGVAYKTLKKIEDPTYGVSHKAETLKTLGDYYGVSASSLLMPAIDEATA